MIFASFHQGKEEIKFAFAFSLSLSFHEPRYVCFSFLIRKDTKQSAAIYLLYSVIPAKAEIHIIKSK